MLDELRTKGHDIDELSVLTDVRVVGHFVEFRGNKEELLHEFKATDMLGFRIGAGKGRFISIYIIRPSALVLC